MWTEPAVLWFGFDEETAALAQKYAYAFMFMAFSSGFDHAVVEFLDAMGHEKYGTIFTVLRNAIDTVSVVVAVTLGIHDLFYIGVIQAALLVPISLANLAFVIRRGWLDDYWEGFAKTLSLRVSSNSALTVDSRSIHDSQYLYSGWSSCTHHDDYRHPIVHCVFAHLWRGKAPHL